MKEKIYANLLKLSMEDYKGYLQEQQQGYIKINKHPEDENIIILNYTEKVTFERRWNKYTLSARGLILDIANANNNDIYILARPFDKFFNFGENLEYEKDIDFREIPIVMEKMDGSLGISYFFKDGYRFATRGSFISDQAIKATEIWNSKYAEIFEHQYGKQCLRYPITMLVEIIYPDNRIVVDYEGMTDLVLLSCREIHQDKTRKISDEFTPQFLQRFGENIGMPVARQYDLTLEKMLEMKKSISANEEGWILRFYSNGKRLKIKGDEYLSVHRAIHGLSLKAKVEAWKDNKMDDLIFRIPEEFRDEIESLKIALDSMHASFYKLHTYVFGRVKDVFEDDRKGFAQYINSKVDPPHRHLMFDAYQKGHVSEQLIREYIYKNYRDLVGDAE